MLRLIMNSCMSSYSMSEAAFLESARWAVASMGLRCSLYFSRGVIEKICWGLRGGLQLGRVRKGLNCCLQLEVRREYLLLQLLGGEERVLQELVLQLLLAIVGQPVVGA